MTDTRKTGTALQAALDQLDVRNEYSTRIADDLLYEQTITLLSAEPGAGKSVLALQMGMTLASLHPDDSSPKIFNRFFCGDPELVYYLQLEGSMTEMLKRMKLMAQAMPHFKPDLFYLDAGTSCNVLKESSADDVVDQIHTIQPSVIIVDPLYMLVSGGLSKDEPASAVARFLLRLVNEIKAAVIVIHHTTKVSYGSDGKRVQKDDAFYGSQWIKAHVDTSYELFPSADKTQVTWKCRKDRYGRVLKEFTTIYNPDTHLSIVKEDAGASDTFESQLETFLKQHRTEAFTSLQLKEQIGCSVAMIRHLRRQPRFQQLVQFEERDGKPTVWRVKAD